MFVIWAIRTLETAYFSLLVMQEVVTQTLVQTSILTRYCLIASLAPFKWCITDMGKVSSH